MGIIHIIRCTYLDSNEMKMMAVLSSSKSKFSNLNKLPDKSNDLRRYIK